MLLGRDSSDNLTLQSQENDFWPFACFLSIGVARAVSIGLDSKRKRLSGEDLLLDLLGEGIGGGVEALKGISLLSHERGERNLQLSVQLGLRLAHLLGALCIGLLLGVLDGVGRVPASGGQDLGRLGLWEYGAAVRLRENTGKHVIVS